MGAGRAGCCHVCDDSDPTWTIMRHGDVALSWACTEHLSEVCDDMQRDWEITKLVVTNHRKASEWAEIHKALDRIGNG